MENDEKDNTQQPLRREEAVELLKDGGEHKFFLSSNGNTPVYIVGEAREKQRFSRLHEDIATSMGHLGIIDTENVRGGYCRVVANKLVHWGDSSYPVTPAKEEEFHELVDEKGVVIIDQWLGQEPDKF